MTTPTLLPLLDYLKHTLLLGEKPVHTVEGGDGLVEHQGDLQSLPGVTVAEDPEDGAPWLVVDRLVKSLPPDPPPEVAAWFDVPAGPYDGPQLRARPKEAPPVAEGEADPFEAIDRAPLEAALLAYAEGPHAAWAAREKGRLRTIKVYRQLFALAETLAQNPDRELVWGWGMAVWKHPSYPSPMCYPLLTQTLDLVIDPRTQQIALVPTASPVHAELLSFLTAKVAGAVRLKGIWEETPELAQSLTPFQTDASRDFFQQAVGLLDADGQLVTNLASAALPKPGRFLQVVERWTIFDRKRSSAALIQDMTQLGQHAQHLDHLPPPALALLTPPEEQELNQDRVAFKGVYDSTAPAATMQDIPVQELYFPLPFNDGQVRLAENMEAGRSQVVQGPPGTGKSHTIVNVMAHSMARGKSLLVTSKGTPALRVLQEKLPAELRALCVFMLQGEKDGMREFEASIDHLSQQISRLDGAQLQADIEHSEHQLDDIHSQLAALDRQMLDVARRHLSPTLVSGQEQAALVLVQAWQEGGDRHAWLDDTLPVAAEVPALPIGVAQELRQQLGDRLTLVSQQVPDRVWTETEALALHQALVTQEQARKELAHSPLKWRSVLADRAQRVTQWREWVQRAQAVLDQAPAWLATLEQAYPKASDEVRAAHDKLVPAIKHYMSKQHAFAIKPVDVPDGAPLNEVLDALKARQAGGSKLSRLWSESKAVRQTLNGVKVDSDPMQEADWPHVVDYLTHRLQGQRLKRKWQGLAPVLGVPHSLDVDLIQQSHEVTRLLVQAPTLVQALPVDGLRLSARTVQEWRDLLAQLLHWDHLEHQVSAGSAAQRRWDAEWSVAQTSPEGEVVNQWQAALRTVGHATFQAADWQALHTVLAQHRQDRPLYQQLLEATDQVAQAGAPQWAQRLRLNPDPAVCPSDWAQAWAWRQVTQVVESLPGLRALAELQEQRVNLEEQLNATRQRVIVQRTWLRVLERATPKVRAGLEAYLKAVKKIGKGTGKAAGRHRQDARVAMAAIYQAIPCWVMPHDRAIEFLPSRVGDFDLVVLDEASQSDLRALPALLRGKQWLIVGDEKQVSPSNVGKVDEEEMQRLRRQYLKDSPFAAQLTPDNSVYDLCKVALAAQGAQVVLVEHFRCHPAIIEFSNREYYHHGLKALRIQKASEKMDPPLVDVLVQGGTRKGKLNLPEARFIVDEIKALVNDPANAQRTVGVVSLLGTEQVSKIQDMLMAELGEEAMLRHQIECGDAARFQGKERSIMFLSMVATPDDHHPATRLDDRQRFNVAASRARDRLYLVRSVGLDDLTSQDDQKRKLVAHFHAPFVLTEEQRQQAEQLFDSPFEKAVYERLVNAGYRVKPQVPVGGFRIDLVVMGGQGRKLAVECDGDRFHGLDQWPADMARQRTLERVGWTFWRCFASSWYRDPAASFADLTATLTRMGIEPGAVSDELDDFWVEHRTVAPRVVEDTAPKKSGRKGKKDKAASPNPSDDASAEASEPETADAATEGPFTLEPVVVHFDDEPPQAAVG